MMKLLRFWWSIDRVRASPRDGVLLRLRPPCLLRVDGRVVEVVRRRVGQTPEGPYVAYHCLSESGPAELRVRPGAGSGPCRVATALWREGDAQRILFDEDIAVFPLHRPRGR